MCVENPKTWYRHVNKVLLTINRTPPRSTKYFPFQILSGLKVKLPDCHDLLQMLEEEEVDELERKKNNIRVEARENIAKI